MEKMNQVSVSEFFAKSKEEMYDMAVDMVEKYNRLIDICNDSAERMADLIERHVKKVDELEKEVNKWRGLAKMNRDTICDQYGVCEEFKNKTAELEEENEKLKVDLIHEREKNEKLARAHAELENDMRKSSVEVSDKDKVIADLEESKRYWKRQSINDQYEINHWKDQERIRTDQLRATESKVDELWKRIEELEEGGDDYGKSGFKRYIEHLIEEEERAVPERFKERLNKEITEIFTKEEETIKYRPSEIDRFTNFLKNEVDKKRIVDIGEGAEKILGVSRELFDAAIKALVDDGYQEIIGRIPQATNSYVYMDMHVLATPDVETRETVNAENIKSLDFDIPCGEDAIE